MHVVICDNNAKNLEGAKNHIDRLGNGAWKGSVEAVEMDVSKVEEFEKVKVSLFSILFGIVWEGMGVRVRVRCEM